VRHISGRHRRRLLVALGLASTFVLAWIILQQGLDRADKIASVGGLVVALITLILTLASVSSDSETREDDGAVSSALAASVAAQWTEEERLRRLHDPEPLPVQWHAVGPPISDYWANIRTDGEQNRLTLDGQLADILHLFIRRVPRRRLVILGGAGYGKTILVTRLLLDMISVREVADAVPVLFSLATWDPIHESVVDWMARSLRADHPVTRDGSQVRRLISSGLILPIFDGLDEMSADLRSPAIAAINRLGAQQQFVLTSRRDEYVETVNHTDVVTAAAVVELEQLVPTTVCGYLRRATPPGRERLWNKVFNRIIQSPRGRLARALSTPLTVSLARAAYSNEPSQPTDLLGPRFRSEADIAAHLIGSLIPSVFPGSPVDRHWSSSKAVRWHTFIAKRLSSTRSRDLVWWAFAPWVDGSVMAITLMVLVAIFAALWVAANLGTAVMYMAIALVGIGFFVLRSSDHPVMVSIAPRRFFRPFLRLLGLGLALALFNFTAIGKAEVIYGTVAVGASLGFIAGLLGAMTAPADASKAASPRATLHADRRITLTFCSLLGLFCGVGLAVSGGVTHGPAGFGAGILAGLVSTLFSPWGRFFVARIFLALRGECPLRLMEFLHVSHRRGVLRQVGAQYQFRHVLLQEHLAPMPIASVQSDDGPQMVPQMEITHFGFRYVITIVGAILTIPAGYMASVSSGVFFPDMPAPTRMIAFPATAVLGPVLLLSFGRFANVWLRLLSIVLSAVMVYTVYSAASGRFGGFRMLASGLQVLGTLLIAAAWWVGVRVSTRSAVQDEKVPDPTTRKPGGTT
jgi:hypothetical protein